MRILLVEDDTMLGGAIEEHLSSRGHAIDRVLWLEDAEVALKTTPYDLVLLDLMLPDGSGVEFLRKRRLSGDTTPVIILTARDQISDRIAGLDTGADDYIVKPFDLDELSSRITAVERRYHGNPNPLINIGELQVDLATRRIYGAETSISLTAREWAIFEALIQHPGAILSRSRLEDRLFAFGSEVEGNAIEVYISRLRKKLGWKWIETVRGLGYRFAVS